MSERVQDLYKEKEFESLLTSARMNAANDWEEEFVASLQGKYEQFGRRMYLSDAQKDNLERIANDD